MHCRRFDMSPFLLSPFWTCRRYDLYPNKQHKVRDLNAVPELLFIIYYNAMVCTKYTVGRKSFYKRFILHGLPFFAVAGQMDFLLNTGFVLGFFNWIRSERVIFP